MGNGGRKGNVGDRFGMRVVDAPRAKVTDRPVTQQPRNGPVPLGAPVVSRHDPMPDVVVRGVSGDVGSQKSIGSHNEEARRWTFLVGCALLVGGAAGFTVGWLARGWFL